MDPVHSLILRIRRRILREETQCKAITKLQRWWRHPKCYRCKHFMSTPFPICEECYYDKYSHYPGEFRGEE